MWAIYLVSIVASHGEVDANAVLGVYIGKINEPNRQPNQVYLKSINLQDLQYLLLLAQTNMVQSRLSFHLNQHMVMIKDTSLYLQAMEDALTRKDTHQIRPAIKHYKDSTCHWH
jgi:hypothetical protein